MAYIGNSAANQTFTPIIDTFNGNGSTTAFTLTYPVASVAQVEAYISNVPQQPGVAYTVLGNTITFTSAPPSGTANIYVRYTSPITQIMQPGQGTVGTTQLMDAAVTPSKINLNTITATGGTITTYGGYKYHTFTSSSSFQVTAGSGIFEYLVIAGGGGGGTDHGGGGGAGGVLAGYVNTGTGTYTVTIGAGGLTGTNGSNSVLSGVATATGGGAGGGATANGSTGGSGGGGCGNNSVSTTGGAGTATQGNNGGANNTSAGAEAGGGGGGAGAPGFIPGSNTSRGANGGVGTAAFSAWGLATSTGELVGGTYYYAGGGGGGTNAGGNGGLGGLGGGAKGGGPTAGESFAGTANTGGGGGGVGNGAPTVSKAGGSGIVIIRYTA